MKIIFNVNKVDYLLKDGTGDILLYRYNGTKKDKKGDEVELTSFVGAFRNSFEALGYIVRDQEYNNDITSILELKQMYETVLKNLLDS